MHILIFLGIIVGVIGWFAFWIHVAEETEDGVALALGAAIGLFILSMLCWSLWNIT